MSKKINIIQFIGFGGEGTRMADRPCIGICHYRKLRGIVVDKDAEARENERKPCIGICYILKKWRLEKLERKKKEQMEKKEKDI